VIHVLCPLATVRIESTPGGGLDCETVGHWSSVELRSV
jgi:hypothetical protein